MSDQSTLPAAAKAVVITGQGTTAVQEVPLPKLKDDYILVRVKAVAVNPTDWKHVDLMPNTLDEVRGARVGCDYAGVVVEVGRAVTKDFRKGDRVCGMCHGSNAVYHEGGAFGDYIVAKGDLQIKTPDNLTDEQAATLGVAISTVGQGLYQALKLPLPSPTSTPSGPSSPILIYGGSSAMGMMGIQFAKASGCAVLATCSPRNFEAVRALGADAVFDYGSPACAAEIRARTGNELRLVWDCIAEPATAALCARAMGDGGGEYRSLLPVDDKVFNEARGADQGRVNSGSTLGYTVMGEAFFKSGRTTPARKEDFEFAKMFWELAREMLASGKVKTVKTIVNRGGEGLEGVRRGLKFLKDGKVSGGKLVYTL